MMIEAIIVKLLNIGIDTNQILIASLMAAGLALVMALSSGLTNRSLVKILGPTIATPLFLKIGVYLFRTFIGIFGKDTTVLILFFYYIFCALLILGMFMNILFSKGREIEEEE